MSNSHDLAGLFSPKSVALVGATDHPTSFGGRVFQQMTGFGFGGKIYPVNPRLKELNGYTCYPSVLDLPERPDHVGLIVSTARVFDALEDCAKIGVPFATVFSGGFAEMGTEEGRLRQARLAEFAKRSGMRIMGPNCNGIVNFVDRFAMTSTAAIKGPRVSAGDIAVVSHSGGFGQINIMYRAMEIGLGISYQASCGNEADIDTLDFARFMLNAQATRVLLMAVESIKDGEKFRTLARESVELEKPIVILKAGRTDAGGRAAASHTGAIAGVDEIYDAVFRQYGVTRVYECNELYETAVLLRKRKWPKGRGAASVSPTGGNIVQVADAGAVFGIQWPSYSAQTRSGLEALLPGYGQVTNPTDMTSLATGDRVLYYKALATITADPAVDTMAPIFASGTVADLKQGGEFIVNSEKQAAMLWVGGCTDDPNFTARDLIKAGVPVYRDATSCMRAVSATVKFSEHLKAYRSGETEPRRPDGIDREGTAAKLHACGAKLTEREAKDVLAGYGFPVTRERLATTREEAIGHAREIGGKVALKIDSPDIAHKTEAGAIRLGVNGDQAVGEGFDAVLAAARAYDADAHVNGVLVQEMAPAGVEMMLGVVRDRVFGPVVAVGLGGIYVEVLKDIAYRAAPVTPQDAHAMLGELRSVKLLDGVRGMAPRDRNALADAIVRLSWFAHDFRSEIVELDMNPVIVLEDGAGARIVDALIVRASDA